MSLILAMLSHVIQYVPRFQTRRNGVGSSFVDLFMLSDNDVHVHVVHVSAEGVIPTLEEAREARERAGHQGWRGGVTAETCHHYLMLSAEEVPPGHTEFKCSPPIRSITNQLKLWDYIREQRLDLIASDHSPSTANLKGPNFMEAWGGISGCTN